MALQATHPSAVTLTVGGACLRTGQGGGPVLNATGDRQYGLVNEVATRRHHKRVSVFMIDCPELELELQLQQKLDGGGHTVTA